MAQQQYSRNNVPTKGLYTSAVSDSIPPDYSAWCQNVRFRYGKIQKAPGRSIQLQNMTNPLLDFASRYATDGSIDWLGLTAAADTGQVFLYNNSLHMFPTQVATLPPANLNPDGSYSRFSWTDGEEQIFIVRNSQVYALTKDQGTGIWSGAIPDPSNSPICKFVEYFDNRVFAMNVAGTPNRLQWSTRGDYTNWQTVQTFGGFLDLYDGYVEPINNGRVLNDRLVAYRRRSITDIVSTGDDTAPFLPQGRVYGVGCAAPWTLQSAGQFHIFLANDWNVYTWDGNQLNVVGTPVHSLIRRIVDTNKLEFGTDCAFGVMFMGFKEYWMVFPSVMASGTTILIYDYLRDTWTRDTLPNLSALYEILDQGPVGSPGYNGANYPTKWPMLMSGRGTSYFLIDERIDGDRLNDPANGSMELWWDTPDFYYDPKSALQNGTMERVFIAQDVPVNEIDPQYMTMVSLDRGTTFAVQKPTIPQRLLWGFNFVDINCTSNVYRLRFYYPPGAPAAPNPSWRSYTVIYVLTGEYFPELKTLGTVYVEHTGSSDVQTTSASVGQTRVVMAPDEPGSANF